MDERPQTFSSNEETPVAMGIQRREFLKRSALAGTGTFLGQRLLTDGNPVRSNVALATVSQVAIEKVAVRLRTHGSNYGLRLDPRVSLLDLLREQLDLTGTKKGCNHRLLVV
jgi:xanthine dehydrogenase YagT iron-sulfur-binding subunit